MRRRYPNDPVREANERICDHVQNRGPEFSLLYYNLTSQDRERYNVDHNSTPQEIEEAIKKRILDYVPYSYRETVCTCYQPTGNDRVTCGTCNKYRRHYFSRCEICKEQKLKVGTWKHHRTSTTGPNIFVDTKIPSQDFGMEFRRLNAVLLCWECLCELDPATEDDVPPKFTLQEVRDIDDILSDGFDDFGDFEL